MRHATMHRPTHALAATLAIAGSLAAQDRDLVAGRVLTKDGEPWADATVVLAALPMAAAPQLGEIDRVEVTSSHSGIFRARVLPDRTYVAWVATFDDDRLLRHTAPAHDVRPGAIVELVEQTPIPDPTLAVQGLDAWREHGPFRIELRSRVAELGSVVLDLDEDDRAPLPDWPPTPLMALVLDADGEPFHVYSSYRDTPVAADPPEPRTVVQAKVPPPRALPVVVRDSDGEPIAGARIRHQVDSTWSSDWPGRLYGWRRGQIWREGPVTDAEGRATIEVPLGFDPLDPDGKLSYQELILEATKDGYARSHSGLANRKFFVDGRQVEERLTEIPFTLGAPEPITGRIELAPGEPLANHDVVVALTSKIAYENGWRHVPRTFQVRTDAEGNFALADPPADAYEAEFHLLLPPELHAEWSGTTTGFLSRTAMAWQPGNDSDRTLPPVTLSSFREVQVTTSGTTAGPRPRDIALVIPLGARKEAEIPEIPWLTVTDAAGRASLRLPPGRYGFLQVGAETYVAEEFEVPAGAEALDLEFAARDFAWMRLLVETADGPAKAGSVSVRSTSWSSGLERNPPPLQNILQNMADRIAESAKVQDGELDIRCFPNLPGFGMEFVIDIRGVGESEMIPLKPVEERQTVRIQ